MRTILQGLCLLLVVTGFVCGPARAQQADSSLNTSDVGAELRALREALLRTQQQVTAQQREIEELKRRTTVDETSSAQNGQLTAISSAVPSGGYARANLEKRPVVRGAKGDGTEEASPLSLKVRDAVFTPGGFFDFENIYRTTNTQSNLATSFATIPFSSTPQGHLSEYRATAQFSRLDLKITDKFGANDVLGYCETDFSGNDAANVYQSVNGHTLRLRLCFMDLKRGKWEILGGQTWSWLTPNRSGVGPMPSDLAITYNEDQNIGVGLPYTRAAEFRAAYHLNDHWAIGAGIEDPNQFIGAFVALPTAIATTVGSQFDNGAQIGTPNLFPDILAKIAYDTSLGGRHFHLEGVGLATGARAGMFPAGSASFSPHTVVGGGGQVASNFELFRNFLLLANAFWSDGGAHYLVGTGPQVVLRPNAAGTDFTPSMVHAGAGSAGFEWIANQKTTLAVYYGANYFQRNFFPDTTNTAHPNTIIGYGGPGSANTNNRTIQEVTIDWVQTFWKNPSFGSLQYYTQYSYLTRAPWFVAPATPKDAHLSMVYAGVRYVLPTTSGTLLPAPDAK
jgi:hypothetical protein